MGADGAGARGGGDVVGGEGLLEDVGDVVALAVLEVEHAPAADGVAAGAFDEGVDAAGVVDVARLGGDKQDGVDAFHGDDADDAGEGTALAAAHGVGERGAEILGRAGGYGKEGVRLAGEDVDIEGVDEVEQGFAGRRVAADEEGVAARVRADAAGGAGIGLEDFGEVVG